MDDCLPPFMTICFQSLLIFFKYVCLCIINRRSFSYTYLYCDFYDYVFLFLFIYENYVNYL